MAGACALAVVTGMTPGSRAAASSTAWKTVWYENFSGPAGSGVSAKNWTYQTGQGGFGNDEVEDMTDSPSNVHLDGVGDLDITALCQGGQWTSGRIKTTQQFGAPAGGELRVIASIQQPDPAGGLGYWPLLAAGPRLLAAGRGDRRAGGRQRGQRAFRALHCGNFTVRNADGTYGPCHEHTGLSSGLRPCSGCQAGYHTYSVIIDRRVPGDEHIDWYLDGREFFAVSESQVSALVWTQAVDHGFAIILDLVGGTYPDAVCGCSTPTGQTTSGGTMSVRYVGVYQR